MEDRLVALAVLTGALLSVYAVGCSDTHERPLRRVVAEEGDEDCDGTGDVDCRAWVYDAMGRVIEEQLDALCNGEPDECIVFSYDAEGHLRSMARDLGCDGTGDADCVEWTYDAEGHALSGGFSEECGEMPDSCASWTYDGGRRTAEERDGDCDGSTAASSCFVWRYDDAGLLTSQGLDDDCDGAADSDCEAWTYDELDRAATFERDFDCDGIPDADCSVWMYEPSLSPLPEELLCEESTYAVCMDLHATSERADADCDGSPDECYRWTYDANGYPLRVELDLGCDERADSCVRWVYE